MRANVRTMSFERIAHENSLLSWNVMIEKMEMEVEGEKEEERTASHHCTLSDVDARGCPSHSPSPPPLPSRSAMKTATNRPTPLRHRPRPRISFGMVYIVRFLPQLGDHPSVSSGAPIALGEPIPPHVSDVQDNVFDLDLYEETRPSHQRRSFQQLRISAEERTRILLNMGYSKREIVGQVQDIHMVRESRRRTTRQKQLDAYYGALLRRIGGQNNHVQTV